MNARRKKEEKIAEGTLQSKSIKSVSHEKIPEWLKDELEIMGICPQDGKVICQKDKQERINSGTLHGGEAIEPGTLHGGEAIEPGTLHGGEAIEPGTLHGGEAIEPGTLHGGEAIEPGTLHGGEAIEPGTLHGGEAIEPGTLHVSKNETLNKGTLCALYSPCTYRTKNGKGYFEFQFVDMSTHIDIDIVSLPPDQGRDVGAAMTHWLPSERGNGKKICFSKGHEPKTTDSARNLLMQWSELYQTYIETGETMDEQIAKNHKK